MKPDAPFFVGYLPVPPGLRGFLGAVSAAVLLASAALGLALSATVPDPGGGGFRWDLGPQTLVGVVRAAPYGTVTLTQPVGTLAAGHTVMLSGNGKTGVRDQATPLDGTGATVTGFLLQRGDLDMLQVDTMAPGAAAAPVADVDLGRWRISGEICDGKCVAGAMRPGTGLSHKACANFCLIGDIPPVLVTTAPVAGQNYLLIAGPDGGPIPAGLLDYVAVLVEVEGQVTRRGDLLILRIDPDSVRVL